MLTTSPSLCLSLDGLSVSLIVSSWVTFLQDSLLRVTWYGKETGRGPKMSVKILCVWAPIET